MKNDKKVLDKKIQEAKKKITQAKEKGLIKPHTEAFIKYPVKLESHKGSINYFKK